MVTHSIEPLGRRRYWPIYEAAAANALPVGLHTSGYNGHAVTPTGWPSLLRRGTPRGRDLAAGAGGELVCEGVLAHLPSCAW